MTDVHTSQGAAAVTDTVQTGATEQARAEEKRVFTLSPELSVVSEPGSIQAEEIGALRTHLLANHLRERRRSLLVCGASPDVGCTYVTASVGLALANAGVRTLIIDANLRDPGVDRMIRPETPVIGLRQCLEDDPALLADAICDNVVPGLSVLFAGGAASNPQELLSGAAFKLLVTNCLRDFDLVLVDVPASNRCADAQIVATVLRYAMVVTRRNVSFLSDVRLLVRQLESSGATVVGTFLNDI